MRSAGNFHPQWGYLAPAPSFLRGVRTVLVATAVGATAGAAVVVSLLERPGADAENSIAAHALVTSVPVVAAAPPVSMRAASRSRTPIAAPPASQGLLAQAPAGAATLQPTQSPPASSKPVLADAASANSASSTRPATQPGPPAQAASATESKPAVPAKRFAGRRHSTASNERRWHENGWRRRRWRDNGFAHLLRFRAFSSRGSSGDYPN